MQGNETSLIEFQKKFANECDCQMYLFRRRWPDGYQCPRCAHNQAYVHRTRRLYQCKCCGYQVSLTAGTIFHKTRIPLLKWFWMIFLLGRQKSGVSMLSLQRMLDIKSYKTVWVMGHKIRKAMQEGDARLNLVGLMEMDDSLGRTTCQVFNKCQHERTPLVVGSANCEVRVPPLAHTLVANLKGSIRGVFHGVSSKHLPRYLAEFLFRFNQRLWESQMFERILVACVSANTITYSELRA